MCGICGIAHSDPTRPADTRALSQMRDVLAHRGPDATGHHVEPGISLGSRRLAILDRSDRGRMPMSTPDGRFWIVYNGEVFNYQELRAPLAARGYCFRSNTDTEVVLALFAAEGPAMLSRLNGEFAIAIWDRQHQRLFLARDRLGVKPLFYTIHRGDLYFASEEKALFAAGVPARFDHGVWHELLCFRFVAGEGTPFEGIRRLLPGHYLWWSEGHTQLRRWWNLGDRARALRESPPADPVGWYGMTFDDAVKLRLISDVPVGVLLSGGLDSSSIAASQARQHVGTVSSFTVGFAERDYDEEPLARSVAEHCGLDGHYIQVPATRLHALVNEASWYSDEPLAHDSDGHLLAVAQHAKPCITVLLSGEGADETLGGYVRYMPLRYRVFMAAIAPALPHMRGILNRRWKKLARLLELGSLREAVLYNACDTLPEDLVELGLTEASTSLEYRESVLSEAEQVYPWNLARQAMYLDQHTFLCSVLDRNDRMTMGASVECRVPFLDYRLVEGVAALPTRALFSGSGDKPLLRLSLGNRLPGRNLRHRKWGFGVPWKQYVKEVPELRCAVAELPRNPLILDAPIDQRRLKTQLDSFWKGDDRLFSAILGLLMITQAWEAVQTRGYSLFRNSRVMTGLMSASIAAVELLMPGVR